MLKVNIYKVIILKEASGQSLYPLRRFLGLLIIPGLHDTLYPLNKIYTLYTERVIELFIYKPLIDIYYLLKLYTLRASLAVGLFIILVFLLLSLFPRRILILVHASAMIPLNHDLEVSGQGVDLGPVYPLKINALKYNIYT